MNNKGQTNAIKNLDDLRMAKRKLKLQMKVAENKHENSFVNKAFNVVKNLQSDSSFTSSRVENALNWAGDKASKKYPMKGFTKILISGLIMIAVPIITSKIQEYIEEKL
ncbi:hypothetical protein [Empedobacter brevis]|uniref:hypothetical protein n=1 Tax=Empedobacter brevis TaxID=247 RepID=UPI0039AFA7FD